MAATAFLQPCLLFETSASDDLDMVVPDEYQADIAFTVPDPSFNQLGLDCSIKPLALPQESPKLRCQTDLAAADELKPYHIQAGIEYRPVYNGANAPCSSSSKLEPVAVKTERPSSASGQEGMPAWSYLLDDFVVTPPASPGAVPEDGDRSSSADDSGLDLTNLTDLCDGDYRAVPPGLSPASDAGVVPGSRNTSPAATRRPASAERRRRARQRQQTAPGSSKAGKRKAKGAKLTSKEKLALAAAAGELPADHKPARGRGRHTQLANMTAAQKQAEADARLEKNRQSARDFRVRRKQMIGSLETQVARFKKRDHEQAKEIARLRRMVESLQARLREVSAQ